MQRTHPRYVAELRNPDENKTFKLGKYLIYSTIIRGGRPQVRVQHYVTNNLVIGRDIIEYAAHYRMINNKRPI